MPKQPFDWQFEEEEEEEEEELWETETYLDPAARPRRRLGRRAATVLACLLTLVVSTAGFYLWLKYQDGMTAIRRDIEGVVALEHVAWKTVDDVTFSTTLDPQADGSWRSSMERAFAYGRPWGVQAVYSAESRVEKVDVRGNRAVVEVLIPALVPGGSEYRETRFYRYSGDQWLRTSPDAGIWGPVTEDASSAHFRFTYHPRDREAVKEVLSDVEAFYARVHTDLGLRQPVSESLQIDVLPRTDLMTYRFTGNRLAVPSPGLLPTPANVGPGAGLKQAIARAIVQQVMEAGRVEGSLDSTGLAFADGVRHWEAWNWAGGVLPWNEAGQLAVLREARKSGNLIPLGDITSSWLGGGNRAIGHAEAILLADYVATAYGRGRFGEILKVWPEHKSWMEIAPQVLGVSFDDFEAGWQAHLDRVLDRPGSVAAGDNRDTHTN